MSGFVDAFIPCRQGSKRVPDKNTKPFARNGSSLLELKILDLLDLNGINRIVLSTDDEKCAEQARRISSSIVIIERPKALAADQTKISDLAKHASQIVESEYVLWTHVTSPLFKRQKYKEILFSFENIEGPGKSMAAVQRLQSYLFNEEKKAFHESKSGSTELWPSTQTLAPVFQVNNAAFLAPRTSLAAGERLTMNWHFFECTPIESLDVDTWEDWELASMVHGAIFK